MTLTTEQRRAIFVDVMRTTDCPGGITKPQLVGVIDALDDWWDTSGAAAANTAIPQPQRGIDALDDWWDTSGAAAANTAIPQPQRGILTNKQKARLFAMLLEARYGVA